MASSCGRETVFITNEIYECRNKRKRNVEKVCGLCDDFLSHACSMGILRVFFGSINILVIIQLAIGVGAVYVIRYFHLWFLLDSSLIVSPIVFPLAFSINIDFHRREKILEKLGDLKASVMVFYWCMREWTHASGLGSDWLNSIRLKITCFLLNIREYLVTEKVQKRKILLKVIYEDLSIIHHLFWEIRASNLPNNSPLVSRLMQTLTDMSLSFECLQNIREYRSSRAIQSFNKVMVFFLPVLLSPYFVYLGKTSNNKWTPYYISIVSVFIFSTLQGVHDKLDNPFDGMGEDDIDLDVFEEWAIEILEQNNIMEERMDTEVSLSVKLNEINHCFLC